MFLEKNNLKKNLVSGGCDISSETALRLTSWDKSTLVMAWCHQATSHYPNQC